MASPNTLKIRSGDKMSGREARALIIEAAQAHRTGFYKEGNALYQQANPNEYVTMCYWRGQMLLALQDKP